MALNEVLRRPEGKTLEVKRDLSNPEGVLKSIVAFPSSRRPQYLSQKGLDGGVYVQVGSTPSG